MSDETKLTEHYLIRPRIGRPGEFDLVEGYASQMAMVTRAGTLADVAALGRALVAFAGGDAAKLSDFARDLIDEFGDSSGPLVGIEYAEHPQAEADAREERNRTARELLVAYVAQLEADAARSSLVAAIAAHLPPADILNRVALAGRAYLDANNEHRDEDGRTAAEHAFDRFVEAHEELAASAHLPPAAPLTVGAALGMPASQRREAVVEYVDEDGWWQARIDAEHNVQARALHTIGGTPRWPRRLWAYRVDGVALALPCRLVPLADADASPETRGPL